MNEQTPIIPYKPIGIIHSPFKEPKGTPIQPRKSGGVGGSVEVFPEYKDGLSDLDGFSHIILIYHMHLVNKFSLKVVPFLDDVMRGLFATRAPWRPNPIGMSVVRLEKIEGNTLFISELDMIDGTPLLDIKPYVTEFDVRAVDKAGWLEEKTKEIKKTVDDGRFTK